MEQGLERVLRLVAEGRLTAEEAGPILDALGAAEGVRGKPGPTQPPGPSTEGDTDRVPRFARIEVRDGGKRVVDLRVPISLGRFALRRVPGLSAQHIADVEDAVASGNLGPILDVEDADGDGVRIVLE